MRPLIKRTLQEHIENKCFKGKIILLIGPRQVGKSTLLHGICKKFGEYLFLDGDDPDVRSKLDNPNFEQLKLLVGRYSLIFIDEAQRIKNIGLMLKMIHDRMAGVQVLVSGSSALDLNAQTQESLTGRKWEYQLYPISWEEWYRHLDYLSLSQQLESRIVYGMYPEVLNQPGEEKQILKELTMSYLYKDILALSGIKKPDVLEKLVVALAYQIGSEVSYNELAQLLRIDKNTVMNYIDLLEKAYVVYRLNPFSSNQRNEIKTNRKVYFYDTGIRNAVISNFDNLQLRPDKGALWENFVINERMKYLHYHQQDVQHFFWRAIQGGEVDLLEQKGNQLQAYEIKWNSKSKVKLPASFSKHYDTIPIAVHPENFIHFVVNE